MDAKARTHFCEAPLNSSHSDSGLANRPSAYLIMVRGGIPGTMFRVGSDDTTLGRSTENTFALDDMTVSRRHATIKLDAHGMVTLIDQGSTNGTFVNSRRIKAGWPVGLDEGDRIQLGSGIVLKLVRLDSSDEHFQRQMFERTVRDGLTGVYNRAYFLNQVGGLSARGAAQGVGLAILMVDIDHFKRINDRYGHLVGDIVLRDVSAVIRESTRTEDLVARYGGEEFIVALPSSSPDLATERAERIRCNVANRRIRAAVGEIRVTASIGVAHGLPQWPVNAVSLIQAADEALYQAKSEGRNCVILGRQAFRPMSKETQSVEVVTSL
jgi:two-component system, cell cycle response regulator